MRIVELFSKRKADAARSGQPDVYQYEFIPDPVINQIIMIMGDAIGRYWAPRGRFEYGEENSNDVWDFLMESLAREYGDTGITSRDNRAAAESFLQGRTTVDRKLDLIELAFSVIDTDMRKISDYDLNNRGGSLSPDNAIDELNYRLRQGGVGYQFEAGKIIQVDSQYVHAEVVKAALTLIHDEGFKGVEDEFLDAHQHYRQGEFKDAIVDAGAAFESVLKSIAERKGWECPKDGRVSDLLKVVRKNGLFPDYLDKSFDQLLAVLKSGLPEVRNNEGSHGQGSLPKEVPGHVAAFALHQAATNIVFLVECMKAHKG